MGTDRPKPISMYPPGFSSSEPASEGGAAPPSIYPPGFSGTESRRMPIGIALLPRALRTILVADGTVTKLLEAYFWEPIEVRITQQDIIKESVRTGEEQQDVVHREVTLRRTHRDLVVAVARSTVLLKHLEPELQKRLLTGDGGIGALLRTRRLETYREQRSVLQRAAGDHDSALLFVAPEDPVVERTYLIHHAGRPIIEITEVFPIDAFVE